MKQHRRTSTARYSVKEGRHKSLHIFYSIYVKFLEKAKPKRYKVEGWLLGMAMGIGLGVGLNEKSNGVIEKI